eukprot:TRINITY_DN3502_c0_g3_i2.p1 TRINITY_DN3502_c0_g3~~TRINITY_DN3502_c0_g3_i2.p1  ORF type:complete len:653 (+),score=239.74 TRINITY_DN3502_c0_g3_i2:114-1961(+)
MPTPEHRCSRRSLVWLTPPSSPTVAARMQQSQRSAGLAQTRYRPSPRSADVLGVTQLCRTPLRGMCRSVPRSPLLPAHDVHLRCVSESPKSPPVAPPICPLRADSPATPPPAAPVAPVPHVTGGSSARTPEPRPAWRGSPPPPPPSPLQVVPEPPPPQHVRQRRAATPPRSPARTPPPEAEPLSPPPQYSCRLFAATPRDAAAPQLRTAATPPRSQLHRSPSACTPLPEEPLHRSPSACTPLPEEPLPPPPQYSRRAGASTPRDGRAPAHEAAPTLHAATPVRSELSPLPLCAGVAPPRSPPCVRGSCPPAAAPSPTAASARAARDSAHPPAAAPLSEVGGRPQTPLTRPAQVQAAVLQTQTPPTTPRRRREANAELLRRWRARLRELGAAAGRPRAGTGAALLPPSRTMRPSSPPLRRLSEAGPPGWRAGAATPPRAPAAGAAPPPASPPTPAGATLWASAAARAAAQPPSPPARPPAGWALLPTARSVASSGEWEQGPPLADLFLSLEDEPQRIPFDQRRLLDEMHERLLQDPAAELTGADSCAICLEPLSSRPALVPLPLSDSGGAEFMDDEKGRVVMTACKHLFHQSCILAWMIDNTALRCPLCRAALGGE